MKNMPTKLYIAIFLIIFIFSLVYKFNKQNSPNLAKPAKSVIYLSPPKETQVSVKLDLNGTLDCTYPDYEEGWFVTAYPDGTIINNKDNKEYSYLFWEGKSQTKYNMNEGFVVKGTDTAEFLQSTLSTLGLTPKEYNEFIVYWLPQMQNSPFNLISFQHEAYTESVKLTLTPTPDSLLRVFMVYKPLTQWEEVKPQQLPTFERTGFAVVEWGGALVTVE